MRNDDAWFVKSATGLNYRPVRWPGWVVLAVYVVAILALTPLLFRFRTLYYALLVILSVSLVLTAIRTSRSE